MNTLLVFAISGILVSVSSHNCRSGFQPNIKLGEEVDEKSSLLLYKNFNKAGDPGEDVFTIIKEPRIPSSKKISRIEIKNDLPGNNYGCASIIEGGIGHNSVTIRLESLPQKAVYDFIVTIHSK